jgi:hypothetical protein
VNVVLVDKFPVLWEPDVAFVPDHPPEAVQDVVFVELQVSVDELPETMELGSAAKLTIGVADGGGVPVPAACL